MLSVKNGIKYVYLYLINSLKMKAANYSEFRKDLKKFLDEVEDNHEVVVVKRNSGSGAVLISLEEYNSLLETVHLLKSPANAEHLRASMREYKIGQLHSLDIKNLAAE